MAQKNESKDGYRSLGKSEIVVEIKRIFVHVLKVKSIELIGG
jgi:hypothetical protein